MGTGTVKRNECLRHFINFLHAGSVLPASAKSNSSWRVCDWSWKGAARAHSGKHHRDQPE